jgi:hypothetical protein
VFTEASLVSSDDVCEEVTGIHDAKNNTAIIGRLRRPKVILFIKTIPTGHKYCIKLLYCTGKNETCYLRLIPATAGIH